MVFGSSPVVGGQVYPLWLGSWVVHAMCLVSCCTCLRSAACVKIGHTAHTLSSAYAADITEQSALLLPYVQAAFPGAVVIASTEEASCTAAHGSMQGLPCPSRTTAFNKRHLRDLAQEHANLPPLHVTPHVYGRAK